MESTVPVLGVDSHVGKIQLDADGINLVCGKVKKLTVITGQEEAFTGDIAITVESFSQVQKWSRMKRGLLWT